MEGVIFIYVVLALAYLVLMILLIVKFFQMASDLRVLKEFITKQNSNTQTSNSQSSDYDVNLSNTNSSQYSNFEVVSVDGKLKEQVDLLAKTLLPNHCIVKALGNPELLIWTKQNWVDKVAEKKSHFFNLLYKSF
jgi:hypothetical protein